MHWYSITNSILVVLFLSLLVVSILVRNLKRDIAGYNAIAALADEDVDKTGWKFVHADVFRPPQNNPMFFCVFIGTGVQIFLATLVCICLSALLNPMVGMTLTGIVPFAAAYVEFFFIMTSLWMDQFYWIYFDCLPHSLHYLCWNHSLACVLPVVRQEPPLVVVLLLYLRKYCLLHIRLQHHLVPHSRGIKDGYDLPSLLWIHVLILLRHVFGDGYCWCLDFLVVYSQNLCNHQGGLREHMKLIYLEDHFNCVVWTCFAHRARWLYSHTY